MMSRILCVYVGLYLKLCHAFVKWYTWLGAQLRLGHLRAKAIAVDVWCAKDVIKVGVVDVEDIRNVNKVIGHLSCRIDITRRLRPRVTDGSVHDCVDGWGRGANKRSIDKSAIE
jgi:hypothetical protein